jgi:hypothetical protein
MAKLGFTGLRSHKIAAKESSLQRYRIPSGRH